MSNVKSRWNINTKADLNNNNNNNNNTVVPLSKRGVVNGNQNITSHRSHSHPHKPPVPKANQSQATMSNNNQSMDSPSNISPRIMSKEVQDRLLGKIDSSKSRLCSTVHHGAPIRALSQPKLMKSIEQQPIIKPRPMSAEKVLVHDVSCSPIQFSVRDEDMQVSDKAFAV